MIKSVDVKTIDEEVLFDLFGDNLTIYSPGDYELEDEEYRVDECALELRSDEGTIVVVDDTGSGADYLIEVLDAEDQIVK